MEYSDVSEMFFIPRSFHLLAVKSYKTARVMQLMLLDFNKLYYYHIFSMHASTTSLTNIDPK